MMLVLVLIVLASVLIDTVYASSDVGPPRICTTFTFTLCDEDLRGYFDPRPSCTTQPLLLPSDNETNLLLFKYWFGCFLIGALCLVLGVVYRARINVPSLATRASSHADPASPQINSTQQVITKDPLQEASHEAEPALSSRPQPQPSTVPSERGTRGSSPPAIQFSPTRRTQHSVPTQEDAAGTPVEASVLTSASPPTLLGDNNQRTPGKRRAAPIKSGSSSLSTNGPVIPERIGGRIGDSYSEANDPRVSIESWYNGGKQIVLRPKLQHSPSIHQLLEEEHIPETVSIRSFHLHGDDAPSCLVKTPGLGRALLREQGFRAMDECIEGSSILQQICSISFLFVGLDWNHDQARLLSGPTHDLEWLRQLFSMARDTVNFYSLPGFSATLTTIRTAVWNAFKQSQLQTAVILYFVGHSDEYGAFELYDGNFIRASTLVRWITEIRKQTKHLPVWIILDHCRPNAPISPVTRIPGEDIYVLWSCSPGQSAGSVGIDSNLPNSSLLQALFLTMGDILNSPSGLSGSLLERVDEWMLRVVRTTRGIICNQKGCPVPWNDCQCSSCVSGGHCRHSMHSTFPHPAQNVVGVFWGSEDPVDAARLLRLARPLLNRFGIQIGQIARGINENIWFRTYNNLKESTNERNLSPPVGPVARRGKSPHMAVASQPVSPVD